ncbi:MAG: hypothetical protein E3J72_18030 [Planctomycetota bacterium]|nr:MAG: hypothetical protein E3J72_18030 [Planctomycetota bacterium]
MDALRKIVLSQAPRLLGLMDRDRHSRTYGCCERYYWHYKLHDFPNCRFQEIGEILALLYKNDFEGNRYCGKEKVRAWALAAAEFWIEWQRPGGSFDEAYPNEHSFCSTAFSTLSAVRTWKLLGAKPPDRLAKTGKWLSKKKNEKRNISNQMAAAALALHELSLLTGEGDHKLAANAKIDRIVSEQHKSGYFLEYDGGDTGYQSVTLSLLMRFLELDPRYDLKEAVIRGFKWIEPRIDETGNWSAAGNSRGARFLFPNGFALKKNPVLERIERGLADNVLLHPGWMDDRYAIGLTLDYLLAWLELSGSGEKK